MPTPDTTNDLLRQLIAEVRGLRADQRRATTSQLTRHDRQTLELVLPAVCMLFDEGQLFTARDIIQHPSAGLRALLGTQSTKALGRMLSRAAESGVVFGFLVDLVGDENNASLYRVTKVDQS